VDYQQIFQLIKRLFVQVNQLYLPTYQLALLEQQHIVGTLEPTLRL
jgi:hypothetical protein